MPFIDLPLKIGDRVRIVCPEIPCLCVDRTIGPDGTLDLPLLGTIPAASLDLLAVANSLMSKLLLDSKPVKIDVSRLGLSVGEVQIIGAVEHPMSLYAPRGISRDRLLAAAVTLREADLSLLSAARRTLPGESVFVPTVSLARKISVLGGVISPRMLPPTNGLSLSAALDSAGGLSVHADHESVLVERNGENIPLALPRDGAFAILPGDTIRVGLIEVRRFVIVKGAVAKPGAVAFGPGMTALQAIESAGGLLEKAKAGTLVWQTGAKTFRLNIAFLLQRRIPDPVISAQDTLVIEVGL